MHPWNSTSGCALAKCMSSKNFGKRNPLSFPMGPKNTHCELNFCFATPWTSSSDVIVSFFLNFIITSIEIQKFPGQSATEGSVTEKHEFHSVFFHQMGTDASEDLLVVSLAKFRKFRFYFILGATFFWSKYHDVSGIVFVYSYQMFKKIYNKNYSHTEVSEDGRFLFVTMSKGCHPFNQLFYYDLSAVSNKVTGKFELIPLFDKFDATYEVHKLFYIIYLIFLRWWTLMKILHWSWQIMNPLCLN